MEKIVFVVGPTATGKTELAFDIARKIGGEIVSADSMLVYKEPCIITSKPPCFMLKKVKHHFVNIVSVKDEYDVSQYHKKASAIIKSLFERKVPVIVCGGTGLYMKILLDGIFKGASKDESLREGFIKEAEIKGKDALHKRLMEVDPESAEKIKPNDLKRIVRALEVYLLTGVPISELQKTKEGIWGNYPVEIFGLRLERAFLYEKINKRVDEMVELGAVEEVRKLISLPLSLTAGKIIGINELKRVINEDCSLEEAKSLMSKNTRNFAKRQVTWFKKDKRINWINIETRSTEEIAEKILKGNG